MNIRIHAAAITTLAILASSTPAQAADLRAQARPRPKLDLTQAGRCITTLTPAAGADLGQLAETDEYKLREEYCGKQLIQSGPIISLGGLLLVGWRFGSSDTTFFVAPAATVQAGARIPLVRPELDLLQDEGGKPVYYALPDTGRFYMDMNVSASVGLAGLIDPADDPPDPEAAAPTALYLGFELGSRRWEGNGQRASRIAGTVGVIGGYIFGIGDAGSGALLAIQPGFVAEF